MQLVALDLLGLAAEEILLYKIWQYLTTYVKHQDTYLFTYLDIGFY